MDEAKDRKRRRTWIPVDQKHKFWPEIWWDSPFGNVSIPPRASRHVSALASHARTSHARTEITTKCPLANFGIFNGNILFRSLMMVRRCAGWLVSFRSYIPDSNSCNVCMQNMVSPNPSPIPSLVMCMTSTIMMRFNNENSPFVQQHIHTHWQSLHRFSMGFHTEPTICHFSSCLFCVWLSHGYCFSSIVVWCCALSRCSQPSLFSVRRGLRNCGAYSSYSRMRVVYLFFFLAKLKIAVNTFVHLSASGTTTICHIRK